MRADACFKLFGQKIYYSVGNEEKVGRLIQIRIDPNEKILVGIDEDGFIEEYAINDLNVEVSNTRQKDFAKQIIKYVNKEVNSFKFDLGEYRKDKIINIIERINDINAKETILSCFAIDNQLENCENIYALIHEQSLSDEEKEMLCGVLAYKQHDSKEAYRVFSSIWLKNKMDLDACRDFLLVADEFDNDALCFFLLKHFFKMNNKYIEDKYYMNLWWKYLFYAIKYNNFDLLQNISINKWNVRILIDSFIYIFHMYNMEHLAVWLTNLFINGNNSILQRNNEDLADIQKAIDELNLYKNYLPVTAEGYYLRFEACLERIIESYASQENDESNEEKTGYIYEYVKSRNYGFIIGFDFQKYFYYLDQVAENLKKRILENIYSDKNIANEDRLLVQFRCECYNKKIQAMDII